MTLSLSAIDRASGAFGIIIASSSPAIASRCIGLRPGVGASASQNITDPRLSGLILDRIAGGASASAALEAVVAEHELRDYRQLTALDGEGRTAAFSGAKSLGTHHHLAGDGVVAAGNMLVDTKVIDAYVRGFETSVESELEGRLLDGLQSALEAGGEQGPVYAAGLVVVRDVEWPVTSLRIDWSDRPLELLRAAWRVWAPQREDYVLRAFDPAGSPPFGVPGDL